jgi:SlyX protein
MNEQRLIDLETKFSFQDDQIEQLQKTVHEQYLKIENLEKNLKLLFERLNNLEGGSSDIPNEKPPHY